jgi:hypothetical protein
MEVHNDEQGIDDDGGFKINFTVSWDVMPCTSVKV